MMRGEGLSKSSSNSNSSSSSTSPSASPSELLLVQSTGSTGNSRSGSRRCRVGRSEKNGGDSFSPEDTGCVNKCYGNVLKARRNKTQEYVPVDRSERDGDGGDSFSTEDSVGWVNKHRVRSEVC
jgi:hypothetical protein